MLIWQGRKEEGGRKEELMSNFSPSFLPLMAVEKSRWAYEMRTSKVVLRKHSATTPMA